MPGVREPLDAARVGAEDRAVLVEPEASGAGFSKLAIARSAPVRRSRTAPASPVRSVRGRSQPNAEQSAAGGDRHRPAVEREVDALADSLIARATPRSRRMSPPATSVQAVAGS